MTPAALSSIARQRIFARVGMFTSATVMLITAATFLPYQSLWGDEVTQLSGLNLGPVEVTRWLAGDDLYRFDVPPDRMPPLSYWIGWLWGQGFGLTETAQRWLSVVCVTLATMILFQTAQRAYGTPAAWFAGLFFALSPNVVLIGVEIRAYAMFLLAAAVAFAGFVRYLSPARSPGHLVTMVAGCIAAMYLHFFGLLLAGSLMVGLLFTAWQAKRPWRPLVLAGVALAVASAGLFPFVRAALVVSGEDNAPPSFNPLEMVRLAFRQFAHVSLMVHWPVLLAALFSVALLAGAACFRRRASFRPNRALVVALASGLAVIVAARMVISGLIASNVTYNVWMLPGVILLLSSGLAVRADKVRAVARVAAVILVLANAWGCVQLARQGAAFAHGPYGRLAPLIAHRTPERSVVLYDQPADMNWQVFFPLRYRYGTELRQYELVSSDTGTLQVRQLPDGQEPEPLAIGPNDMLFVIRAETTYSKQLVHYLRTSDAELGDGTAAELLKKSAAWQLQRETFFPGVFSADVDLFRPQ